MFQFSSNSLNWIKPYLKDRKQSVFDNKLNRLSKMLRLVFRKDLFLAQFFFFFFVNDLPLFIDETYLELYADDTTVHYASKNKIV